MAELKELEPGGIGRKRLREVVLTSQSPSPMPVSWNSLLNARPDGLQVRRTEIENINDFLEPGLLRKCETGTASSRTGAGYLGRENNKCPASPPTMVKPGGLPGTVSDPCATRSGTHRPT